jgi:hypothetical protein
MPRQAKSQKPTARTALQGFDSRDGNFGPLDQDLAESRPSGETTLKKEPFPAPRSTPVRWAEPPARERASAEVAKILGGGQRISLTCESPLLGSLLLGGNP